MFSFFVHEKHGLALDTSLQHIAWFSCPSWLFLFTSCHREAQGHFWFM